MKIRILVLLILWVQVFSAQDIFLSEAKTYHENNDSRLYRIENDSLATYLGKIEINGFLQNETEAYTKFYKKAKTIGANAYIYVGNVDLDGNIVPSSYKEIRLYYLPTLQPKLNQFSIYATNKEMKIRVGEDIIRLPPQTYITRELPIGGSIDIATRYFLGSRLFLYYKEGQWEQNFRLRGGGFRSSKSGVEGGLIIKSGDIEHLEISYANFLSLFYNKL